MKTIARRLLARAGYRVTRAGLQHRFHLTDDALDVLRRCRYRPRSVIDVGANVALAERRRDGRLRMGDVMFVARWSALLEDTRWQ